MYLVFKCVQGLLPGSVFQALSNPAVNGPVPQVPTVWTVTKPVGIKKKKKKFSFVNLPDKSTGKI